MNRDDQPGYWRATRRFAATSIAAAVAVGLIVHLVTTRIGALARPELPVEYLAAALFAPLALVALAFWFAARQDAIDRAYGMAEDD